MITTIARTMIGTIVARMVMTKIAKKDNDHHQILIFTKLTEVIVTIVYLAIGKLLLSKNTNSKKRKGGPSPTRSKRGGHSGT